jgi:hypothetical protein
LKSNKLNILFILAIQTLLPMIFIKFIWLWNIIYLFILLYFLHDYEGNQVIKSCIVWLFLKSKSCFQLFLLCKFDTPTRHTCVCFGMIMSQYLRDIMFQCPGFLIRLLLCLVKISR